MHSTSKVDIACYHSLIDPGVNVELAGEYSLVRFAYPDRQVDIKCMDIHDINFFPFSIAGGVTKITIYEVIIIM